MGSHNKRYRRSMLDVRLVGARLLYKPHQASLAAARVRRAARPAAAVGRRPEPGVPLRKETHTAYPRAHDGGGPP